MLLTGRGGSTFWGPPPRVGSDRLSSITQERQHANTPTQLTEHLVFPWTRQNPINGVLRSTHHDVGATGTSIWYSPPTRPTWISIVSLQPLTTPIWYRTFTVTARRALSALEAKPLLATHQWAGWGTSQPLVTLTGSETAIGCCPRSAKRITSTATDSTIHTYKEFKCYNDLTTKKCI
jgi:hypothetical protein